MREEGIMAVITMHCLLPSLSTLFLSRCSCGPPLCFRLGSSFSLFLFGPALPVSPFPLPLLLDLVYYDYYLRLSLFLVSGFSFNGNGAPESKGPRYAAQRHTQLGVRSGQTFFLAYRKRKRKNQVSSRGILHVTCAVTVKRVKNQERERSDDPDRRQTNSDGTIGQGLME